MGLFGRTLSPDDGLCTAASIVPSGENAGIERTLPLSGASSASRPLFATSAPVFVLLSESTFEPFTFVGAPQTVYAPSGVTAMSAPYSVD